MTDGTSVAVALPHEHASRPSLDPPPLLALATSLVAPLVHAQVVLEQRASETTSASPSSLVLEQERVLIAIDEQHATARVAQTYHNTQDSVMEGVCSIRAGENSQVTGFAYYNGESRIVGEVFEKEEAQRVYNETTGLKRDPGLLEQTGEGAFTFRVFPIQPDEHKRLEVTLAQRLPRTGTHVTYRLPLSSPRATIHLSLTDRRPVAGLSSSSHKLEAQERAGGWEIQATPLSDQVKELVFGYDLVEPFFQLNATKHQDPGQPAYVALRLATEPQAQRSAKDVTLVLDHSGSMSGGPLEEAKAAAREIVLRLSPSDRLNVIQFDDEATGLYLQTKPVTTSTRAEALAYIEAIGSGSGTDIAKALRLSLSQQRKNAERPIVLLLTDGDSDSRAAFEAAERDRSATRVFTIGLGAAVNRPLLSRLADRKRGRFTYIQSTDAIRASVARLFGQVESAALTSPELHIENGELLYTEPGTLPDLAPGEELLILARAKGNGPMRIQLKGQSPRGPVVTSTTIDLGAPEKHPWVGRLWAQARTQRLLEDITLEGESDERKNEIIELSLAYSFVTPYTAFLAIPEDELTESTASQMTDMRARKQAIMAKRADAVALSRSEMPPGDPVLSVDAPRDAVRVRAFFPFGLTKDLTFDAPSNRWRVRFLVPLEVSDGSYVVPVEVTTKDGKVYRVEGHYVIDSSAPEFEAEAQCHDQTLDLVVFTRTEMREVRAARLTDSNSRIRFVSEGLTNRGYRYRAQLPFTSLDEKHRIVVTDRARNEADEVVSCNAEGSEP